jgi:hypothetical protein
MDVVKKISKILIVFIALIAVFSTIGSAGLAVSAAEPDKNDDSITDEQLRDELAEELKFYFETVGHIDEEGNYVVDNEELFVQKFSEDAEFTTVARGSIAEYGTCIIVNSVLFGGVAWELANAVTAEQGFIDAVTSLNYSLASDIIIRVGKNVLPKAAFKQLTQLNLATSIVAAIWTCRTV